jgi:hypothetical protein
MSLLALRMRAHWGLYGKEVAMNLPGHAGAVMWARSRLRRTSRYSRIILGFAAVALCQAGCARHSTARTPRNDPTQKVLIAQPCDGLTIPSQAADRSESRVFVQLAKVIDEGLPKPIGPWLQHHAVNVNSVGGFIATPGTPTTVPSFHCLDPDCVKQEIRTLAVTCYLPEISSDRLKIILRFEQQPNESNDKQAVSIETRDQEPAIVDVGNDKSGGSLMVLTPYVLSNQRSMGRLLECKDQARKFSAPPAD